jgi:DNA polymerase III epsilon subunit-like protein
MPPPTFLFIDTETTGLRPGFHEIIEIGCVVAESHMDLFGKEQLVETAARTWRIHPLYPERAQAEALKINGYGRRDWSDAVPKDRAYRELAELGKGKILLAQNMSFDWSFLLAEAQTVNVAIENVFFRKLDLMSMAFLYARIKDLELKRFSLEAMCEHFGVNNPAAHEALADARAAFEVFKHLWER